MFVEFTPVSHARAVFDNHKEQGAHSTRISFCYPPMPPKAGKAKAAKAGAGPKAGVKAGAKAGAPAAKGLGKGPRPMGESRQVGGRTILELAASNPAQHAHLYGL